jgi:hypothetical protein
LGFSFRTDLLDSTRTRAQLLEEVDLLDQLISNPRVSQVDHFESQKLAGIIEHLENLGSKFRFTIFDDFRQFSPIFANFLKKQFYDPIFAITSSILCKSLFLPTLYLGGNVRKHNIGHSSQNEILMFFRKKQTFGYFDSNFFS